jgi:putative colanic acid biosynthesis UDP-glucose lipid carrier transferase
VRPARLTSEFLVTVVQVLDVLIIWAAAAIAWLYFWSGGTDDRTTVVLVAFAGGITYLQISGSVHQSWRGGEVRRLLFRVLVVWMSTLGTLALLMLALGAWTEDFRQWFIAWAVIGLGSLAVERGAFYGLLHWIRRYGYNHKRVAIVGSGAVVDDLRARARAATWSGFDIVSTIPPHGPVDKIGDVDEVWVALALPDAHLVPGVLRALGKTAANIRFVPDLSTVRLLSHGSTEVLGFAMLDLASTPMTGLNRFVKAIEDRVLAALILVLISPLLVAIAIAVKLTSPGPIIFRQLRHGWNGKEITVYKFRTMVEHAEPDGKVTQASKGDPRVTPFGRFLRQTSLDELPQFVNVLQGRMSIVGPRPHAVEHNHFYEDLVPLYVARHKVKPGITGWAQVNGYRGRTDTVDQMRARIEHDLWYIENWSLWLDLKILLLTIVDGFVHRNAY